MALPPAPRYDLLPLIRAVVGPGLLASDMDPATMRVETSQSVHTIITDERAAVALGVERRTIQRWRRDGMSFVQAEAACERARIHPLCVWPDFYAGAMDYIEAAADAADEHQHQRTYNREYNRRRRNPLGAAA